MGKKEDSLHEMVIDDIDTYYLVEKFRFLNKE
jgi:hypothetical protein